LSEVDPAKKTPANNFSVDKPALNIAEQAPAFEGLLSVAAAPSEVRYDVILDRELFADWLQRLQNAAAFSFDTETTALEIMDARIVGVNFSVEAGVAAYVPCGHDYMGAPEQLPLDWVLQQLKPILEDETKIKIGQNLKYDRSV